MFRFPLQKTSDEAPASTVGASVGPLTRETNVPDSDDASKSSTFGETKPSDAAIERRDSAAAPAAAEGGAEGEVEGAGKRELGGETEIKGEREEAGEVGALEGEGEGTRTIAESTEVGSERGEAEARGRETCTEDPEDTQANGEEEEEFNPYCFIAHLPPYNTVKHHTPEVTCSYFFYKEGARKLDVNCANTCAPT